MGEPLALLVKLHTLYHPRHSMCSSAEDLPLRFFISLATSAASPSGLGSVSLYQSTGRDSITLGLLLNPPIERVHRIAPKIHDGLGIVRHAHAGCMGFSQFPQPLRDRGLAGQPSGVVWYIEINAGPEGEAPRQGSNYRSNAEKGSH